MVYEYKVNVGKVRDIVHHLTGRWLDLFIGVLFTILVSKPINLPTETF